MNVIVTGGTKGIGRAIAEAFFQIGANLAICSRNQADLEALKKDFDQRREDQSVFIMQCDMSSKSDIISFAKEVLNQFSDIDVLINNAGVFIPGAICDEEEGALDLMINTNLYSAYHLSRAIVPNMKTRRTGHIFNICSIASKIAYPNGGSYSISKFALLGLNNVLREELKPHGVKVTAVLPGATWSNSWAGVELPRDRLMEAADIADSIICAYQMKPSAVVEEIIIRPQLGDL